MNSYPAGSWSNYGNWAAKCSIKMQVIFVLTTNQIVENLMKFDLEGPTFSINTVLEIHTLFNCKWKLARLVGLDKAPVQCLENEVP